MKRSLLAIFACALALAKNAPAAEFKLGPHTFTLPDGFTIEVAAPSSLVPRPIEADFDEQGRLYVTDSSGSNDKVTKQLADKPHRILRLEDTDGDGVFDNSVVFADKMMFPEGALWHDGSLYVSAPPSIWKLTDTNNDGVADVRVEWFKGQSLGGCANDLHGPYLGPDGWIYWCKGGFEKQTHPLGNGKTFTSRASHIWRARPDGTGLEPIMTGGMDNPVGLAWSPEGELFLCGTFFQHPGGGKRDGIIHVLYGGVYGKENDVLEGHPRTGELLPIMTHLGPAAPCGMARYESAVFGTNYQDNLFVCNFNLHKISRHVLRESGSTYATTDSDFLVSDNTDFHPTDVFEDADGSLLVIDTGGWYKLCCPTSQLPKPDVLGAIYRIRRNGAPKVNDPRGLKLAWDKMKPEELGKLLSDSRPAVRHRAMRESMQHKGDVVSLLAGASSGSADTRRNAVWALTRIDTRLAREVVRAVFWESDEKVRRAVVHSISLWQDSNAVPRLLGLLKEPNVQLRRVAAEALGRIGEHSSVPSLLSVFADYGPQDRAHEHSLEFALIKLGDPGAIRSQINSDNIFVRRASLIALDQMPGGNLKPEQVIPLLTSTDPQLKQTANWIISHHPEWAGALAGFLKERMAVPNLSDAERVELQQQLAQFARHSSTQDLLFDAARKAATPVRLIALRAMAQSGVKETPADWATALAVAVMDSDLEVVRQAIATTRALPAPKINGGNLGLYLWHLGSGTRGVQCPDALRVEALAAIPQPSWPSDDGNVALLVSSLRADQPATQRSAAATAIAKAKLSEAQLMSVAGALREAGPMELPKLLPVFAHASDEALGLRVIDALKEARAFRSLRAEQVRPNLTNFPGTVRAKADELLATLNTDTAKQKARLDEIFLNLKSGDVRRGQTVFNSQKAACSTCHAIGYLGGNLGPDLTRIGTIRTERDLLEAVVFPSASFVRSFEPMLVVTKSGDEHSGILRRDAPDEVVLATGPNAEVRLARADIAEMRPGTVSVMPQGLDEQLTREELADLLAFLKATKW
jgi:putative membrane-bound dehydrogenase-like protein